MTCLVVVTCGRLRGQRDERAQKVRDLHRANHHYNEVRREVMTKQIQLDEHKKRDHELQNRFILFYVSTHPSVVAILLHSSERS